MDLSFLNFIYLAEISNIDKILNLMIALLTYVNLIIISQKYNQ